MTPRRILTVCLGVSAYPTAVLQPGEKPLRYLAASATALHALFRGIWSGDDSTHHLIVDEGATRAGFDQVLSRSAGEYDLFVIYLGGHGRAGGRKPFKFLFHGERPEDAVARAQEIDAALGRPNAANVLLLLDACFAGAYGQETTFFRAARGSTRLCIASSRADQKSWEDRHFRRSLFADAVVKALTDETHIGRCKSVVGEFFTEVADDVARHAFALKASVAQEPILIGEPSAALTLPTVSRPADTTRSMTTYQVLVRRSRQIAAAVAILAVIGAVLTSYATWRPALNGSGLVELRPGPKWLSPLNIGPWRRRVETDVSATDLKDEDRHAELLDESGFRAWPGLSRAKVRRWADAFVDDYLNAEAGARWRIRLGYADGVARLSTTTRRIVPIRTATVPTATELAAEAKLLDPSAPLSDVWRLQWRDNVAPGACSDSRPSQEQADRVSSYLRLSEAAEFVTWLRGLALAARADDAIGFEEVANVVEMLTTANRTWRREYAATVAAPDEPITGARIAARFTERPTRSEVTALGTVAAAIAARRTDRSVEPVTKAERARILELMDGCSEIASHILAALGRHGDPAQVVAWARSRTRSDQGRLALRELAARDALPDDAIVWMVDTLGFAGSPADRKRAFVGAREWLTGIADLRPLPEPLVARLIDYASERAAAGDGEGKLQAVQIILRSPAGARSATDPRYAALLSASAEARDPLPPTDQELEHAGILARSGVKLNRRQREILMAILESPPGGGTPRVSFTDEDRNGASGATQLVAGATSTHLRAFSRLVVGESGPDCAAGDPRALPFLELAMADALRFGIPAGRLREVATASAVALEHASGNKLDGAELRSRVRCCATDSAARQAHAEIAIAALARMLPDRRSQVLDELRAYWRREQEPEVKLALAATIVRAASDANSTP